MAAFFLAADAYSGLACGDEGSVRIRPGLHRRAAGQLPTFRRASPTKSERNRRARRKLVGFCYDLFHRRQFAVVARRKDHYLVTQGHYPPGLIMVFSPRNDGELATVKQIVAKSYEFATGTSVSL